MSKSSDKKVFRLPAHSVAKITLYRRYLLRYLNVLGNTQFEKIYLLDLFAGEGRDVDGKACSSIAAIEVLKEHVDNSANWCKRVSVFFNDFGNSVIDKKIKKIDRVKKFTEEISLPKTYEVNYSSEDFGEIINKVITRLDRLKSSEKALCFLDPWGYKYSKPHVIREVMRNGNTEVLLFIPICFMHRFAAKALKDEDFIEGQHIESFITELFENDIPDIKNQVLFIKGIQERFRTYLKVKYVDVLYIEKDINQYFALFFFSNSKRGFQKMLEAKWSIDETDGKAFSVRSSSIKPTFFENVDHEDYTYLLFDEIKKKGSMTNQEVFDFGLNNNHLPKHSKKVLDELKKERKIKAIFEDGTIAAGYYIEDNHAKKAIIKLINL